MPRFNERFSEDEISKIHEAIETQINLAEREGREEDVKAWEALAEKTGNWS